MTKWLRVLWLFVVLSGPSTAIQARASERGRALVDYYPSSLFDGGPINFDLHVLDDGVLAVANGQGLVIFDGLRWRVFHHPQRLLPLMQLALLPDGRLFGAYPSDLGYYQRTPEGDFLWHSINHRIPAEHREFASAIGAVYDARRNAVWINAMSRAMFVPLDERAPIRVFKPTGHFSKMLRVDQDIWLHDGKRGVLLADDQREDWSVIPGTELMRNTPEGVVRLNADTQLILIASGQLYRLRAGKLEPIAEDLWPALAAAGPESLQELKDHRIAIGFRNAAPWVIDRDGRLQEQYGERDGVPAEKSFAFVEDHQGGLWVAQHNGLVRIDRASGLSLFDRGAGLTMAQSFARWRGRVYVASATGLHRLQTDEHGAAARFERIQPSLPVAAFAGVVAGDLVVVSSGLHRLSSDSAVPQRIGDSLQAISFHASEQTPGRFWAVMAGSVAQVDVIGSDALVRPLTRIKDPMFGVMEQDHNTLWLNNRGGRLLRLRNPLQADESLESFSPADGLPTGPIRMGIAVAGIWACTNEGLYLFNETSMRFEQPPGLPVELRAGRVFSVTTDDRGNLWAQSATGLGVAWREGDGWRWDRSLLGPVDNRALTLGFEFEGDVVWILRTDGLVRLDRAARADPGAVVVPMLSQIQDLRTQGLLPLAQGVVPLAEGIRDLRFQLGFPVLQKPTSSAFRTRLVGFDSDWSPWGDRSERDYTNLPDGRFRFQIQARDVYGRVASSRSVDFVVAPPWWRATWAYASYLAATIALFFLTARLGARGRQRALLKRQRELEAVVDQRTQELKQKNEQLAEQAERLTEVDRLKTRFFINVGHEFRTPLTLVLGPIDDLLRDARERFSARAREQLEMANRNARRVLDLIVELLDVNRFEHGQMRLTRSSCDLALLAQRALVDHSALLERYGQQSRLQIDGDGPWLAAIDPSQIERALSNLIGNAAKYMARGGCIEMRLRRVDADIEMAVIDQGRGISAAALPHVYDRFFQAEGSDSASGYGIGLALVREIIEAHQGRVAVQSVQGIGSTFLIHLPAIATDIIAPAQWVAGVEPLSCSQAAGSGDKETLRRGRPLVLVVDDHDDLRARARGLLQDRFEVIEAIDGPSAWNSARDSLPDLIVCDVMMPGFDGIELTRRLRAEGDTAAIALLLLTAKAGSEHAVAGLQAGADDYLAKPFDSSELLARIDALLARAQRLRLRLVREQPPLPEPLVQETPDQRWRRRLDALIAQHMDNPEFSIEQLAQEMHNDRSQLFRKCKELMAMSPSEYLRDTRLKRGRGLLEEAAGNVSEVAYAVGFDSLSSFTRAFKARYGLPPSQVTAARKAG